MFNLGIEGYAALGEILGAIAVVASLVYLGRQIHQTNRQAQAEARYSFVEAYSQMNLTIASDKAVASIFRRGLKGETLDEDEFMQFFAVVGQFLNTWSVLFDMTREGLLPPAQWTMIRKDIITMMASPGGARFWNEVGRHGVHEQFVANVDEIIASGETSYTMV